MSRPTMDIDLLGFVDNEVGTAIALMQDVCRQDVEPDGMVFDAASVEGHPIAEDADYPGVRVQLQSRIGTARAKIQIDIGFGDAVYPNPVMADYPVLLDFSAPRLRGYTRESTVAEKLQAMVRRGRLNSRMRDFFDVWLLSREYAFDGENLSGAIRSTFDRRGVAVPVEPVALTRSFAEDSTKHTQWQAFLRKSRLDGAPKDLQQVVQALAEFLQPVLEGMAGARSFADVWRPGGPWRRRSGAG